MKGEKGKCTNFRVLAFRVQDVNRDKYIRN